MSAATFIAGDEMGVLVCTHDWAASPLGPVEIWPQNLKSVVALMLAAPLPMCLMWGPELIQIYNEGYVPIMGTRHPAGLGQPARECWPEVWDVTGPLYGRVFAGETIILQDQLWTIVRHGRPEDTYFTTYFTPVRDDAGAIAGAHAVAFETTEQQAAKAERDQIKEALRRSEARLSAATDLAGLGAYTWWPASGTVEWDGRMRALWGLPPNAHVDLGVVLAGIHPDDRPLIEAIMAAHAQPAPGSVLEVEFRVIGAEDGIERWLSTRARSIGEDGQGVGFIGTVREISEEKRALARLQESKARLQACVDLVGLSSYAWDPATGALQWDARLKALWGLPPDAHVDDTVWLSGVHPEDRPRVEAAAAAAIDPAGDGLYAIEYRIVGLQDGVERWVSTRGRTTLENGRAVGFIGAVREITDRKRVEEQLRHSEARFAAILEQLPVGVALFDRAGRIKLANRIFGPYALDYIPSVNHRESQRWRSYTPEGQLLDRSEYPGARALRGETVVPGTDFLFTSPDGRERWTRQSAAPFRNAAHDVVGAVTVVQDIDREKRAEHTLRESEERFRQFAEHMMDVLWIADAETMQLEYLNPAFERVWGEPRKAMLRDGSGWPQFLHPEDRERALSAVPRILQGEVVVQEYRIVRADGRVRWIRDTGFPIPDGGAVERIGGIAQDLTRQDGSLVYVVNEDDEARASATHLLHGAGYEVQAFASAKALLARAPALVPGCVVLTVDTSEPSGLSIPRELKARHLSLPVIVTGKSHGDIGFGVRAMKAGAVDFLEMPYEDDALLTAIASAQADIRDLAERDRAAEVARMRIAGLSARERQVLDGLLAGGTNKSIARQLGISPRTVEAHRAHVMEQLGARTLPEAVLLAAAAGLQPPPPLDDTDEP